MLRPYHLSSPCSKAAQINLELLFLKFLLKDVNSINEFLLKVSSGREVNSKKHTSIRRPTELFGYVNNREHMLDICTHTGEFRIDLEMS